MNSRYLGTTLALFTLVAAGAMLAFALPVQPSAPDQPPAQAEGKESDEEEVITLDKAPEAVRAAAIKLAGDTKNITKVIKEEDDEDVVTYEVEYNEGATKCAAIFSAAGELIELERGMAEAKLPAAAMAALKEEYPGATFADAQIVTRTYYEIQVVVDGKKHEVKVDAAGRIEDKAKGDEGGEEDKPKEDARAKEGDDGFRKDFAVDKANLVPTGVNPFFDLRPGRVSVFRDGKATLTIRVLDETRVVDGVTTRIVEEREEVDGKPKETSRNYFAIDRTNNDVYYFGEDVDEFDAAGKVSHPGAWLSGVGGARFGLMMPGSPKVGDRFYQEVAPGVAMDRFEIVGVGDPIETPAGKFEHSLHVVETTPLSKDVGYKWYVRGKGLVKDGENVLVSVTPAAR